MESTPLEAFRLFGIRLKGSTTNEQQQSSKDCGALWQRFEQEQVMSSIPNRLSDTVYAVYHAYESDAQGPFSYFIGCKVQDNATLPPGLDELTVPAQRYVKVEAKGKMTGCITEAWKRVWQSKLPRGFGMDFEAYDERSHDWDDAVVDVYVSVKDA